MSDLKISSRAYTKIILHAAKYPHCAINGILLAPKDWSASKGKTLPIVDAIPLFHQCLYVSPMTEIALVQVFYNMVIYRYFIGFTKRLVKD